MRGESSRPGESTTVPVVFGDSPGLLGFLTLTESAEHASKGVVICAPLGHQNICAYRPLRTLAERLAERGLPVLRFDWPGCGDSDDVQLGGSDFDLAVWTTAVRLAVAELRATTGVERVALVGLRIGASLGLMAAEGAHDVSDLCLLAPFASGRAYLRELRALQSLAERSSGQTDTRRPELPEGTIEANGFLVTRAEADALESLDLLTLDLASLAARRALVVTSQPDRGAETLAERLSKRASAVRHDVVPELAHLWAGPNEAALSPRTRDLVCAFLCADERSAAPSGTLSGVRGPSRRGLPLAGGAVREEAVVIETPRGRLVGVTCEPVSPAAETDAWIVLLNAGKVRRVGPNRLWTTFARRWAHAGIPSFRLDCHGIGDSDGDRVDDETLGEDERTQYVPDRVADVRDALAWLADHRGARRFALIGLCSGATLGFQAAVEERGVAGVALINPRVVFWDDRAGPLKAFAAARRIVLAPQLWGRALAGQRPRVRDAVRGAGLTLLRRTDQTWHRGAILESLRELEGRTALLTIFTDGDLGIDYFARHLGPDYPAVLEDAGMPVTFVHGPDHTFRRYWAHELLRDVLEDHLRGIGFLGDGLPGVSTPLALREAGA